jgi:Regulator of G protein signaling domain
VCIIITMSETTYVFERESNRWVFATLWVLIIPSMLYSMYRYWLQRRSQVIRLRGFYATILGDVGTIVYITYIVAQFFVSDDGYPCWFAVSGAYVCNSFIGTIFLVRCWKLYFHFELTHEIAAIDDAEERSRDATNHARSIQSTKSQVDDDEDYQQDEDLHGDAAAVTELQMTPTIKRCDANTDSKVLEQQSELAVTLTMNVGTTAPAVAADDDDYDDDDDEQVEIDIRRTSTAAHDNKDLFAELKPYWFLRNRYLISNSGLMMLGGTFFLITGVLSQVVVFIVSPPKEVRPLEPCEFDSSTIVAITITAIIVAGAAVFAYVIREVVEGLFIKRELTLTSSICGVLLVLWVIARSVTADFDREQFAVSNLLLIFLLSCVWIMSTVYPLAHTASESELFQDMAYTEPSPTPIAGSSSTPRLTPNFTLRDIIENPRGRDLYKQHLVHEFSLENLLFWEAVEQFRNHVHHHGVEDGVAANNARRLYLQYVREGSPYQVNLPYQVRMDLRKALFPSLGLAPSSSEQGLPFDVTAAGSEMGFPEENDDAVSHTRSHAGSTASNGAVRGSRHASMNAAVIWDVSADAFQHAQAVIIALMDGDSFTRFRSTPAFHSYMEEYKQRNEQARLRQDLRRASRLTTDQAMADDLLVRANSASRSRGNSPLVLHRKDRS